MKIAYLVAQRNLGVADGAGYSTHISELKKGMEELGHSVLPLIGTGGSPAAAADRESRSGKGLVKKMCPGIIWEGLKDLNEIGYDGTFHRFHIEKLRDFDPDVIYERTTRFHRAGARLARELDKPLVLEHNCPHMEERTQVGRTPLAFYGRKIDRQNFMAAAGIIVVSSALKSQLKRFGVDDDRIKVIPNGVNPEIFKRNEYDGKAVRERYGLRKKTIVGFTGSFFRWHGLDALLKAAPGLVDLFPDIHFLIVGHGSIKKELEETAKAENLSNSVTFTGKAPAGDVPDYIAAMDIAVMPGSNWYGSPIKIFEYGAMAKPVIAPDTVPVRDVMNDGKDGLLIKSGSAEGFAGAVKKYVRNPDFAESCALTFYNKVLNHYTWKHAASAVTEFMEEILARRRS